MNKRILQVRKEEGLNQDEFAEKLNLTKNFISLIETGKREPSDRTVKDICKTFNINELWLRTGGGEMRLPKTREEDLAHLTVQLLSDEPDSFKNRLISVLSRLSVDEWEMLEKRFSEIVGK